MCLNNTISLVLLGVASIIQAITFSRQLGELRRKQDFDSKQIWALQQEYMRRSSLELEWHKFNPKD